MLIFFVNQVAVPSRTDVKEYQDLKEELDKLVGMINGRFSTPHWSPIRYIYGCIEQVKAVATFDFTMQPDAVKGRPGYRKLISIWKINFHYVILHLQSNGITQL